MIFTDGQILTAEQINQFLVNGSGAMDLTAEQTKLGGYVSSIADCEARAQVVNGTAINFPGWTTSIEAIPGTVLQTAANSPGGEATQERRAFENLVKKDSVPISFSDVAVITYAYASYKMVSVLIPSYDGRLFSSIRLPLRAIKDNFSTTMSGSEGYDKVYTLSLIHI